MHSDWLSGEFRRPRQMLGDQEYDGHLSIHDDQMAEDLGFAGAPIEGPTTSVSSYRCCIKYLVTIGLYAAALVPTIRIWWSRAKRCKPWLRKTPPRA